MCQDFLKNDDKDDEVTDQDLENKVVDECHQKASKPDAFYVKFRMTTWGERMASVVTACGPRGASTQPGIPYHRRLEM